MHTCDIGQSILAIVTLAVPHQQAPANVHGPLHAFYSRLQRAAAIGTSLGPADGTAAGSGKANVPLLSVAGGRGTGFLHNEQAVALSIHLKDTPTLGFRDQG